MAQENPTLSREDEIAASVRALLGLEAMHLGETVFVIGAGPQLASLDERQRARLEDRTTIGVNLTQYVINPTYFLSGHAPQIALAIRTVRDATVIHLRRDALRPVVAGSIVLTKVPFDAVTGLAEAFDPRHPAVATSRNVALAATHLALIMGAERIVYLGVEQRNAEHFYHRDEMVAARIRRDIERYRVLDPTLDRAGDRMISGLGGEGDPTAEPFYELDHTDTFRAYFGAVRDHDVDVVATTADSVVADAGAPVVPLDTLLTEVGP